MRRHVPDVVRRIFQFASTSPVGAPLLLWKNSLASTSQPLPWKNSLTSTSQPLPWKNSLTSTSQPLPRAYIPVQNIQPLISRHAALSNISSKWPRPATPRSAYLGLRRDRLSVPGIVEWTNRRESSVIGQKRWESDDRRSPNSGSPEEANKVKGGGSKHVFQHSENTTASASTGHQSKSFYNRLPNLHRPSKEELLAAATGFWHRTQIRFKWFSIRSVRPFNHEEIFAFLSWIFWGHVLWFVIGTTTFASLTIWAVNTVFAQETLAGWVGNYLTRSSGLKVVFESAIVPRWGDGVISFNKVFVSRRPDTDRSQWPVRKGSSETEAAAAAATAHAEKGKQRNEHQASTSSDDRVDDGNYAQFDVTIENVEVTLSFTKWFNGKGLLRDVSVKGVRGAVDRTSIQPRAGDEDPKSYRHEHNTGDFEIDNFKMEDVLLTIYQPNNFRPFTVSVFTCELPRLRKQWLFYDFLCANTVHGSFDNSLFTIHPRQVHGASGVALLEGQEEGASQWKKHARLRIDGLKIDHLNRGVEGPFSWIYEGNVDIVADVMIPNDADGSIAKVMSDFYDRMEASVISQTQNSRAISPLPDSSTETGHFVSNSAETLDHVQGKMPDASQEEDHRFLVMDIQIHLNDVRATVPIFTRDISYVNNAVVRPIVAYINSQSHGSRNYIPISCRIVKRLSEFDGSWTAFDSGLLDDLSRETYDAFVRDITDRKQRKRRIRKVGLWAAQVAAQALFIGLAGQLA